ncbi:Acyl_transf_3 domain-containing protein [Paraburkholderia tropica]|uniref:acyltransferase family protein n=1 Tax=Paraburkholderia tropica TaxID=92647 RepID=UPI001CAB33CA|nr:acyltransferase [Paraburkholderia tropica]CAG9224185.1 Acyl_transf_3 domain-containing protein [Paraburkholderia tropica]
MSPAITGEDADQTRVIEAMRGIAAIAVAIFHCRLIAWIGIRAYASGPHPRFSLDTVLAYLTIPFVWGPIGVPIFFVISGYCIHRSHAARLARNPQYPLDAHDFLWRRFVRIYPVLFCALLLTWALDNFSLQFHPRDTQLGDGSLWTFVANLLALQGIAAPTYGSNTALWTLSLEVQFYLLYPLLFAAHRRLGPNRTLMALMALAAVSFVLLDRHGVLIFTTYWSSWYLGAWLAERQVRGQRLARGWLLFATPLLLVIGDRLSMGHGRILWCLPWALAFTPCLDALLHARPRGTLAMRMFEKVGAFSYSLYIVHMPVCIALFYWLLNSTRQVSILWAFACFFIALAVAYVFHLLVERPAIAVLRRASAQRQAAARQVGAA